MDHGGCQGHCQHHKLLGIRSSAARQLGAARCHGGASPEATTCANDEDDEGAMHH